MIDEATRTKITELRASGKTIRDIAAELEIGKSTVSDILKRSDKSGQILKPELVITEMATESQASEFMESIAPPPATASSDQMVFLKQFTQKIKKSRKVEREPEPEPEPEPEREPEAEPVRKAPAVVKVQPMDKGTMIANITMLVTTFGPILTAHVKDPEKYIAGLNSRSLTDLKTQLELLEHTKTVTNGGNALRHMFAMVAGGVEKLGPVFKLQTQGYQQAIMAQDQELRMIFQDIAHQRIDHIRKVQSPEARLCFLMAQTMLGVDSRNRTQAVSAPPITSETQANYHDL